MKMKQKTITLFGVGTVILFILLALTPMATATSQAKTKSLQYVKVYVFDEENHNWRYIATMKSGDCALPPGVHKVDGYTFKIVPSCKPHGPIP